MDKPLLSPRPVVEALTAYDAGHHGAGINLSANENSYGLPEELRNRLAGLVGDLAFNRYPDSQAVELCGAIAARHGVDPDQVAVGNGGDELLQALLLAYGGPDRMAVTFVPTFVMYEILAKITGTRFCGLDRDEAFDVPADAVARVSAAGGRIVFACSPNNPTGNIMTAEAIKALAGGIDGLLVIDEAYQEFSPSTAIDLLPNLENIAVLRTFSKAFSLAGLRVGYLIADPRVIENVNKVRLPYNVNVFSQAAAAALMHEPGALTDIIAKIVVERDRVAQAIAALNGFTVYPSQANFLLVDCGGPAENVWNALLEDGILVRNLSGAPRLRNCLRITVGTPPQNDAVVESLARIAELEA